MPRIVVMADQAGELAPHVALDEKLARTDLGSAHFCAHLIERVAWAVEDAGPSDRSLSQAADGRLRGRGRRPGSERGRLLAGFALGARALGRWPR